MWLSHALQGLYKLCSPPTNCFFTPLLSSNHGDNPKTLKASHTFSSNLSSINSCSMVGMMVMSLLFIMLARFVIAFLLRSKHILISWLESPSDLGAQENKVCHCFPFSPIYSSWNDGSRCHDLSFLDVEPNSTFFKRNQLVTFCISQRSSQSDNPNKLGDSRPGYWATWLQLWLKILQKKRIQDLHYSDPFKLPQTKRALTTRPVSVPHEGSSTFLRC